MSARLAQRAGEPASLVLAGARILDPDAGVDRVGDLVVRDGVIGGDPAGLERVDASGLTVVPGFVDPHVHLRTPGQEEAEDISTGSRSAAAGGYVAIVAMPNTRPVVDSAAVLGSLLELAGREAVVPTGFYAAITMGQEGEALTEMGELADLGAAGFTDDGRPVSDARVFQRALQYQKVAGLPLVLHEEDMSLSAGGVMHEGEVSARLGLAGIPGVSEAVAVARDTVLAAYEGGRVHVCHVSSCATVDVLRAAKERGIAVTAEVTPHHLVLTDEAVATLDASRFKMNPPLRAEDDRQALIAALIDGTIDCVATDHAPHPAHLKEAPFEQAPFGVTGLETAFAVLHTRLVMTGELPLETLVRRMSGDAARVVDLPAPSLAGGSPANLAVIDTAATWTVGEGGFQSRSANSSFTGEKLTGQVTMTIAGGQVAWRR